MMHFPTPFSSKVSGQSIIEVLIATVVIALVMTSIVGAMTLSIQSTAESRARSIATHLAQEGLELFRRERATLGWQRFYDESLSGQASRVYCLNTIPSTSAQFSSMSAGECGSATIDDSPMQREATVVRQNTETVSVEVVVTWQNGNKQNSTSVEQIFRKKY